MEAVQQVQRAAVHRLVPLHLQGKVDQKQAQKVLGREVTPALHLIPIQVPRQVKPAVEVVLHLLTSKVVQGITPKTYALLIARSRTITQNQMEAILMGKHVLGQMSNYGLENALQMSRL